ncbi:AI-2E family transporter [Natrinema halophilum]|uniref:AI-2E family transporter n=1 Tax=Natrinema halophilum TaxID=1699371 RepID=A0A7D5H5C5_9EURY|nr:AI-2E family transporter [Natrinema halophilum]QLG47935.1 AI-2E family transporter [Natrinema halophilum]
MADRPGPPDWLVDQPGLTALALISGTLALFVVLPYLQYVLFGVVLAYIMHPVQRRLENYVRSTVAAITVVVATLLVVLLPLVYVVSVAIRQSIRLVSSIRQGQIDVETIEQALATNGYAVDLADLYQSNQNRIATGLQGISTGAIDIVGGLPGVFIGLTITLFVLFALLRDGEKLVMWFQWVLPIDDDVLEELRMGLDRLMWASVVGNVAVAAIQAVMLGIGLAVAGVPAVIFLTVATFLLTLLPLVGAFGVWIPAAVYLLAVGRPTASATLGVYGLFVTFSDSYLRPALIGRSSTFNSAIIVVGIFGGLVVFGAVGLFIGPVVLGGAKITLDSFAREHTGERADESALETAIEEPESKETAVESASTTSEDTKTEPTECANDEAGFEQ